MLRSENGESKSNRTTVTTGTVGGRLVKLKSKTALGATYLSSERLELMVERRLERRFTDDPPYSWFDRSRKFHKFELEPSTVF